MVRFEPDLLCVTPLVCLVTVNDGFGYVFLVVYMNFYHCMNSHHKDHAPKICMLRSFSVPKFNKTFLVSNQDPLFTGVFTCIEFENEFSFL
jgi:hypothetical protein